jgi:hypothetical protein
MLRRAAYSVLALNVAFVLFIAALMLLSSPPAAAQPASPLARETAIEMVQVYRLQRAAGLVDAEERCWTEARQSAKNQQLQALQCVRVLIASGVIDQAMQISEGRGPTPALTGPNQRARFLARTAAMGMDTAAADRIMRLGVQELPAIINGLAESGVR